MRILTGLIFILFFLFSLNSYAGSLSSYVPDSLLVKTIDGKKYILHKVQKSETFTSIAKKYNTTTKALIDANKGVSVLKTGQIIQVPYIEKANAPTEQPQISAISETPAATTIQKEIFHTVKKGETLFSIAKKNNCEVADIKKWNSISGNNIKPGQKLIVGYKETVSSALLNTDAKKPAAEITSTESTNTQTVAPANEKQGSVKATSETMGSTSAGKEVNQITETGEAAWVDDAELNPNKYYALHRTAPIGTIAKVTNKMNGKSVFVKVIGRLPNTGDNYNVMIKISKAAADKMNVIDQKFIAEISYATVN